MDREISNFIDKLLVMFSCFREMHMEKWRKGEIEKKRKDKTIQEAPHRRNSRTKIQKHFALLVGLFLLVGPDNCADAPCGGKHGISGETS